MMIALMVCSGPRPNECAVFEQKKRQGRDERRSLSGPQQLSRFESRESATVAGRAVSTTTRWAALLGGEADAPPVLSVLAPTEIAQQTSGFFILLPPQIHPTLSRKRSVLIVPPGVAALGPQRGLQPAHRRQLSTGLSGRGSRRRRRPCREVPVRELKPLTSRGGRPPPTAPAPPPPPEPWRAAPRRRSAAPQTP